MSLRQSRSTNTIPVNFVKETAQDSEDSKLGSKRKHFDVETCNLDRFDGLYPPSYIVPALKPYREPNEPRMIKKL